MAQQETQSEALFFALKAHNAIPAFEQRCNELSLLPKGWYDGTQGEPADLHALANARYFLRDFHKKHPEAELPGISPDVDGESITLSWPGKSLIFHNDTDVVFVTVEAGMLLNLDNSDLIMSKILEN